MPTKVCDVDEQVIKKKGLVKMSIKILAKPLFITSILHFG